tara:strand:- start:358 stop:870 length:513 start_codon:yes stop_codon:yes gene_type:complete
VTLNEAIIAIPAFVGMGLGIYNLLRDVSKSKVKLKVIPKSVVSHAKDHRGDTLFKWTPHTFDPKISSDKFAIEVINTGLITVTIDNVGFLTQSKANPMQIHKPIPIDGGEWPRRLSPHEAVTVCCDLHSLLASDRAYEIKCAYAETQSGLARKGDSKALKQLVDYAKSIA